MPPKSKPGEGIVIVIDVSPGVRASTSETFFNQAQTCLINILQRKVCAEKCRDMVGIVAFGTDKTENRLATSTQYKHISVIQKPKFVDWDLLQNAKTLPRGSSQGDWLDAIVVAMDLLHDPDGIMFDTKKIVLMTDFNGEFTDDNVETIIAGLKDMEIELSVIGPDVEDDEDENIPSCSNFNGSHSKGTKGKSSLNWNGKPKTPQQLAAESLIKRIVSVVEGIICSFEEAIPQLIFFEKKSQGSASWNAMLDIGAEFQIPITGRIKMKRVTLPSWMKAYAPDETLAILSETSFHKKDENQASVSSDDIISAYKYGSTLVPFGEEDQALRYVCDATGAVLSVIGFTSIVNVPWALRSGDQVLVVTAKDGDEEGAVALSAIIQALKELNMAAITRRVYRKNMNPSLGALIPDITKDYECLIWIALPFQEELRDYSFPSLSRAKSKTSNEQREVMDQFITDMALNLDGEDEENAEELLDPCTVLNPAIQHYYNCLTHRALHPDEPLPPPQQHVLDILSVPPALQEKRNNLVEKFKVHFPSERILDYKQKKINIFNKTTSSIPDNRPSTSSVSRFTLSSNDVLNVNVSQISTATPVQDFYALLKADCPNYPDICRQMSNVLLQLTESLSGNSSTDRVLEDKIAESMKAYRAEALVIDPTPYNDFLRTLKDIIKARNFGVVWTFIVQENLGLISREDSLKSCISSNEAENFLHLEDQRNAGLPIPPTEEVEEGVYDDMLDDL